MTATTAGTTATVPRRNSSQAFTQLFPPDQLQPLVLRQDRDPELARLRELRASVGTCHDVVRLLRDRAGHLRAHALGLRLGLVARHALEAARKHDGLARHR